MTNLAQQPGEGIIEANTYDVAGWEILKRTYLVGDLVMLCCQAPAISKTSINGNRFFAHLHDECTTAPETIWHQAAKRLVSDSLQRLGIDHHVEHADRGRAWQADVLITGTSPHIAIELQHSPQTLAEYRRRHDKYVTAGVECYWLLTEERYLTLTKAMGKERLREESIGVHGAALFTATLDDWLKSARDKRFRWHDGHWRIEQ